VDERARSILAVSVGAIAGALAGYMFFTDQGRRWRSQIEPALEDFGRELGHFRGTLGKAANVASEGWKLLNEAFSEMPGQTRYPHQSNPF